MPIESGRVGGVSFKLHPDFSLVNLYHWLAGDEVHGHRESGFPLPIQGKGYETDPSVW